MNLVRIGSVRDDKHDPSVTTVESLDVTGAHAPPLEIVDLESS
jgi:hypothetical protein